MSDNELAEFYICVDELLGLKEVRNLDLFSQHFNTSRLQHSLNVAFYSYRVCKRLNLDYRSAARAGLLHDLFLYDWRIEKQEEGKHAFVHPVVALNNASRLAELNNIEKDAIIKHMWPVTIRFPRYKESYIVSMVDKFCATMEIYEGFKLFYKKNILAR